MSGQRLRNAAVVVAASALLLAGCGGGGSSSEEGPAATAQSAGSPTVADSPSGRATDSAPSSAGAGNGGPGSSSDDGGSDGAGSSSGDPGAAGSAPDASGAPSARAGGGKRAEAFCETYYHLGRNASANDVKEWAAEVRALKLPAGMPEKARQGLDRLLTVVEESDANVKKMQKDLMKELSGKGRKEVAAFGGWLAKACADQVQEQLKKMRSGPSKKGS